MHPKPLVCIAGCNGFIGQHIVSNLTNVKLYGLDQNKSDKIPSLALDLSKPISDSVISTLPNIDVLIFLVGLAHDKGKKADSELFERVNFLSLKNLLNKLRKLDNLPDKIIFSSTISVYGERYSQQYYDESLLPNPYSPYAVTKLEAEQYLVKNFKEKSWIIRFAPVYAPNFDLNINRRTQIVNRAYKVGNGKHKLSLCNIQNIINTVIAIVNDEVPAGTYNVADEKVYTYNDLLQLNSKQNHYLYIPSIFIMFTFILGKLFKNIFLMENSIKLLTDNIFTSKKLQKFVQLNKSL
jgi:nucleoside-diphosphate-sugar epimerase